MAADRVRKTLINAKVGFFFYFVSIILTFFSRRIFLKCLGDEFMGLAGTLWSILEFLNISEIGINTCIAYFLYKPIAEQDKHKICEIVSLFGYLYRIIGCIIMIGAIIISAFFPLFFANKGVSLGIVYFAFYSFTGSQLISYFINYRQILLDSDQKTYKISIWTQTGGAFTTLIQIALAYHTHNPYLWVIIQFLFSLFTCWVLNLVINHEYPWLKTNKRRGREILKKYPEILIKAKQIFIHRLKNFFLSKSDEILIFAFESLQMVAFYGNYMMIVGKLTALYNSVLVGINASIGNLVAEGNSWNIRKIFWEHLTFRYWTTGVFVIILTFLINPIISWWLGPQYILQDHIVFLILLNMYIMLTGPAVALFINAFGLYDDTWSAYAEGLVNLTITIIVGLNYGLIGILLGKVVSLFLFAVIWRPIYLYKRGFQESTIPYWKGLFTHITILFSCLLLNYLFIKSLRWVILPTIFDIILYGLCIALPIIIIYSILNAFFCPGAKDLLQRILIKIKNK
jgi:O-antigen/teichoic acid export membrane protein